MSKQFLSQIEFADKLVEHSILVRELTNKFVETHDLKYLNQLSTANKEIDSIRNAFTEGSLNE